MSSIQCQCGQHLSLQRSDGTNRIACPVCHAPIAAAPTPIVEAQLAPSATTDNREPKERLPQESEAVPETTRAWLPPLAMALLACIATTTFLYVNVVKKMSGSKPTAPESYDHPAIGGVPFLIESVEDWIEYAIGSAAWMIFKVLCLLLPIGMFVAMFLMNLGLAKLWPPNTNRLAWLQASLSSLIMTYLLITLGSI